MTEVRSSFFTLMLQSTVHLAFVHNCIKIIWSLIAYIQTASTLKMYILQNIKGAVCDVSFDAEGNASGTVGY